MRTPKFKIGDRICAYNYPSYRGVIKAVVTVLGPRYLVKWMDGYKTIEFESFLILDNKILTHMPKWF